MKVLIVGMGFGNLYKEIYEELGYDVVTVDPDITKNATYTSLQEALGTGGIFIASHICTPNFLHYNVAVSLVGHSKIIFVEKPGFKDFNEWAHFKINYPEQRIMMVKNNMWRSNIGYLQEFAKRSFYTEYNWINHDRVPSPGSWFTTKEKAYGGVSRDLLPHLLSLYAAMDEDFLISRTAYYDKKQNWSLVDMEDTDYGTVNKNGVYDVDDECSMHVVDTHGGRNYFNANWRSLNKNDIAIHFQLVNKVETIELGLCPKEAYEAMIQDAITNKNNDKFWRAQFKIDAWIMQRIDLLT